MDSWHATFLGLRHLPREITAFTACCPLVTIKSVHRPKHGADSNAAWASRADWAHRTNAFCTADTAELCGRGPRVILRPPGALRARACSSRTIRPPEAHPAAIRATHVLQRMTPSCKSARSGACCWRTKNGESFLSCARSSTFERRWPGATAVRGYNAKQPVLEPIGSLVIPIRRDSQRPHVGRCVIRAAVPRTAHRRTATTLHQRSLW